MKSKQRRCIPATLLMAAVTATFLSAAPDGAAAPVISRMSPPSALFAFGDEGAPYISRFLPDQRFDLHVTVVPDEGQTIERVEFHVDGRRVRGDVSMTPATVPTASPGTVQCIRRAYSNRRAGVHEIDVLVRQSDGQWGYARGNFEIVEMEIETRGGNAGRNNGPGRSARKAKNLIFMIGDGMGIAHRTAARIMLHGVQQGKANQPLAMDTFPVTGLVMTHSLNSIVTDSSPGAACYSNGNKANNNQQGVWPDDTLDNFDNPRVELIGEYLWRTEGRVLGIVTTSDVFDATPGAFGTHTQNRGAGTGICDQYLDEAVADGGLRVLMGGGRKWFLPQGVPGSQRSANNDYVLPDELAEAWGVSPGVIDPERDLIAAFEAAGFAYAPDKATMDATSTDRLLGLFAYSNMNVAKDKIDKRRGDSTVVDDYGFPDQPMLDEMTFKALEVLSRSRQGFTLMVEAASIDKQAHNMDTERWLLDTIEFDRAIEVAKTFAEYHGDTLVIITADHECAGINIIGASRVTRDELVTRSTSGLGVEAGGPRAGVVGAYESAGFPHYPIAADGYPATTDPDFKMLIGYAANADRYEDWLTNPLPTRDSQQPFNNEAPLNTYPSGPTEHDQAGGFLLAGVTDPANSGTSAVHTASDIPVSAFGLGESAFTGVMDNTDVFFKAMRAALVGESRQR